MIVTLIVGVSLPAFALMQNASVDAVRSEYEQAFNQREKLSTKLSGLESEYLDVLRRVDSAKKRFNSITGRLELESLLRRSKEISTKLSAIQLRLSSLDSRIESKRNFVVRHVKSEMKRLEKSLSKVPKEERRAVVDKLNQLRQTKIRFTAPLPTIQSSYQESLAFRDADSLSDDPDALLAVADELEDSKDQLSKRLAAIENQISELKRTQKLMRRSASFSTEDQFFEESDRARVIAKYDVIQRKAKTTETNSGDNDPQVSAAQGPDSSDPQEGFGATSDGDQASKSPESGGVVDDTNTSRPVQEFEDQIVERVQINGSGDPSRSISGRKFGGNQSMRSRISNLESEKIKLKKRVQKLHKRAKKLRKRADSL